MSKQQAAPRITLASTVVASKDQVSCDLNGEAAILDMRSGTYYGLNPSGAVVWNLIQQPQRVSTLQDALLSEFDVAPDRCQADLLALLNDLASAQLVEVRREPDR